VVQLVDIRAPHLQEPQVGLKNERFCYFKCRNRALFTTIISPQRTLNQAIVLRLEVVYVFGVWNWSQPINVDCFYQANLPNYNDNRSVVNRVTLQILRQPLVATSDLLNVNFSKARARINK